jgi:hypothetical protein
MEVHMDARWCSIVTLGVGLVCGAAGCEKRAAPPATEVYAIALGAGTVNGLPKCAPALAGETAYVQSPASLYSCQSSSWVPIPCTTTLNGTVAYVSATETLLACSGGSWALAAFPPEPPGATSGRGPVGHAGATSLVEQLPVPPSSPCRYGGTEVKRGVDLDGDGALGDGEISSHSFVCKGEPTGEPDPQIRITAEPAGANCQAGGERVDVGVTSHGAFVSQRSAYVCSGAPAKPQTWRRGQAMADASLPIIGESPVVRP